MVSEYLFPPETIAEPAFDPTEIVEFNEARRASGLRRVRACPEGRPVTGVHARGLPEKDALPYAFDRRYLAARDSG